MVHLDSCNMLFNNVIPACLPDISQVAEQDDVNQHLAKGREKTKSLLNQIRLQCDIATSRTSGVNGKGNTAGGGHVDSYSPLMLAGNMDSAGSSSPSANPPRLLETQHPPDIDTDEWSDDSESTTGEKTSSLTRFASKLGFGNSKTNTGNDTNVIRNIIIFGERGSGKSSIVNLLTGADRAEIARGARPCTKFPKEYLLPGVRGNETYQLFDTGGFSEGPEGLLSYKDAKEALFTLVRQLSTKNEDGVQTRRFGTREGRPLSKDFNKFCGKQVPIILVMTHFDFEDDPATSIGKEMVEFRRRKMHFVSVIAGCAGNPDSFSGQQQEHIKKRRDETRSHIIEQINIHAYHITWKRYSRGWKLPS